MLKRKLGNKNAFTLIEIIVVIVILAVLMAVAVPSVMSYMNEGQKAKYETVARAALINTQTAVAEDVASDGKANEDNEVIKWIEGLDKSITDYDKYGSRKSYGGSKVKVYVTEIVLSNQNDLVSATYNITFDGINYREVKVEVNGKMTVGTNTFTKVTPATNYKFSKS